METGTQVERGRCQTSRPFHAPILQLEITSVPKKWSQPFARQCLGQCLGSSLAWHGKAYAFNAKQPSLWQSHESDDWLRSLNQLLSIQMISGSFLFVIVKLACNLLSPITSYNCMIHCIGSMVCLLQILCGATVRKVSKGFLIIAQTAPAWNSSLEQRIKSDL